MRKNIFLPVTVTVLLWVTWLVVLMNMSEAAKIPAALGGFIAGWYTNKCIIEIKGALKHDAAGRFNGE